MPFTVQQIISDLRKPVTADPEESIHVALDRMLKDDYSQLPVVKGTGQDAQFYLITIDSILTKLHAFGDKPADSKLLVKEALVKTSVHFPNDDLSDVLKALRDLPAVLVINSERQLVNIVTPYDTTVYFRQWSEDMMRAEDVEKSLKWYINAAFKTGDGKIDETARQVAINDIASANKNLRRKFELAVGKYLGEQRSDATLLNQEWVGKAFWELVKAPLPTPPNISSDIATAEGVAVDVWSSTQEFRKLFESALGMYMKERAAVEASCKATWLDESFHFLADPKEKPADFNDLTLGDYIRLFFHPRCWERCFQVFDKDKATIWFMLEGVRKTRNKLAHFHEDEIIAQDRAQLRICAEFLQDHEKAAQVLFEKTAPSPSAIDDPNVSKENS